MTASPIPIHRQHSHAFRGLTLVEMLVAMTLTLVLMGAVAQIFGMLGKGVNSSRSIAELNDRMRATAYRLRQDLGGITVNLSAIPPVKAAFNTGYFEYIEGKESDGFTYFDTTNGPFNKANGGYDAGAKKWVGNPEPYQTAVGSDDRLVGDIDDVLLFTTRSTGEMFSGRVDTRNANLEGGALRSPFAEVIWFCRPTMNTSNPKTYALYRRQRLVMAHPGAEPFVNTTSSGAAANSFGGPPNTLPFSSWSAIYNLTDVSCRQQGSVVVPNCLGDLSRRENRFMHSPIFPYIFPIPLYAGAADLANLTFDNNSNRLGEDILLPNVIAFDVRAWDPDAEVRGIPAMLTTGTNRNATQLAVQPGDAGYTMPIGPSDIVGTTGAYVDLGWNNSPARVAVGTTLARPVFQGNGVAASNAPLTATLGLYPTYDTWTDYYEVNGVDDDNDTVIDQGTNGLDDNVNLLVDEPAEQETSAPYPVSLGGVQVRIRCYEPSSRQVRQITILQSF